MSDKTTTSRKMRFWLLGLGKAERAEKVIETQIWDRLNWKRSDTKRGAKDCWKRFDQIAPGDAVCIRTHSTRKVTVSAEGEVIEKYADGRLRLDIEQSQYTGLPPKGAGAGNKDTICEATAPAAIEFYFRKKHGTRGYGYSSQKSEQGENLQVGSRMSTLLRRASNVVLEGVPGTGKTYAIDKEICKHWSRRQPSNGDGGETPALVGKGREAYAITLHPATTYEDFVEGLRPSSGTVGESHSASNPGPRAPGTARKVAYGDKPAKTNQRYFHIEQPDIHGSAGGNSSFRMQDGFFLRVCAEATNNPESDYVVLLDEINRCNVPKVMGDLLTTIERSKRAKWVESEGGYWDLSKCQVVTLPGSKRLFFVPDNVYVVATMNTTDRSVAPLDAALRRRFAFVRLWPMGFGPSATVASADEAASVIWSAGKPSSNTPAGPFVEAVRAWWTLNERLQNKGPDAMLGHSYLFDLAEDMRDETQLHEQRAAVLHHFNFHLLPQLVDVAVSNHLEAELVAGATKLGKLTEDLFSAASGFRLTGSMPTGSGLLQVPTLTLVDDGSARGSQS